MRNGQNKRMRGRNNHRKNHNPMVRVYELNGPDVKIRGNPSHIAEKYIQLARDAQTSGDPIAAENYYQHAEHYYRVIAVAQEQFRQNNPHFARVENEMQGARDDGFDDGDDDGQSMGGAGDSPYGTREPQPYIPRDAQPFPQQQPHQPQRPQQGNATAEGDVDRLPSFITGGQQPQQHSLIKASSRDRTAMTTSPTVSRCIAAGAGTAARAPTCRAAVTAETSRPRASDRAHRLWSEVTPAHRPALLRSCYAPPIRSVLRAQARAPAPAPDAPARAAPERRDRPASSPRRCGRRRTA